MILLVRSGGLGDCLLTLPVAVLLKRRHPDVALHVLGNAAMVSVARLCPAIDAAFSLDTSMFAGLFVTSDAPSSGLAAFFRRYTGVFLYTAASPDAVCSRIRSCGAGDCHARHPLPPPGFGGHCLDHLCAIIPGAAVSRDERDTLCRIERPLSARSGVIMHPGSGGTAKMWPLGRFIELARRLPGSVRFLVGPAERERGLVDELAARRMPFVEAPGPDEAADLLSGASLYVGNDSGMSHLAAMCATPSVVLFGPTDPIVWRPIGPCVTIVRAADGSMNGLAVDKVLAACERTMGGSA